MGCKEETRVINENTYYCRQWAADRALLMKFRMAGIFGPAFTDLAVGIANDDFMKASGAIEKLFAGEKNSPEKILEFMKEVVESSTWNEKRITAANFNEIYSNNLMEFYRAFLFVIEVNYKSLLGGKLQGLTGKLELIKQALTKEG